MSRTLHDQFAKQALCALLNPFGSAKPSLEVVPEVLKVDVYFEPAPEAAHGLEAFGLLGRLVLLGPTLLEPFSGVPSRSTLNGCLLKRAAMQGKLEREAKTTNKSDQHRGSTRKLPWLWILLPHAPTSLLHDFCGPPPEPTPSEASKWPTGVHEMPTAHRAGFVVLDALPKSPDTLLLRILGQGDVVAGAIQELKMLPRDHALYTAAVTLLVNWRIMMKAKKALWPNIQEMEMKAHQWIDLETWEKQTRDGGFKDGKKTGFRDGVHVGRQDTLLKQIQLKFGPPSESVVAQIRMVQDFARLDQLAERILTATSLGDMGLE